MIGYSKILQAISQGVTLKLFYVLKSPKIFVKNFKNTSNNIKLVKDFFNAY